MKDQGYGICSTFDTVTLILHELWLFGVGRVMDERVMMGRDAIKA